MGKPAPGMVRVVSGGISNSVALETPFASVFELWALLTATIKYCLPSLGSPRSEVAFVTCTAKS